MEYSSYLSKDRQRSSLIKHLYIHGRYLHKGSIKFSLNHNPIEKYELNTCTENYTC